jgi:4-amino-4-deoxy-L-arabinose transferase-like glycosyltransferase
MHIKYWIGICVVILISVIPLFSHLDSLPIQPYDEARLVTNALEMQRGHSSWLVPTYRGNPDMWNTKPPLLIWLQAISMHAFGVNELAVRIPSALAALVTCLLLFWLCARKLNKPWLGIIIVAVLVTSGGYVRVHGTRTADYDALLTFFTTGYTLFYFLFLKEQKVKYIYLTLLFLVLGFLTKGIAAMFFTPVLFLFSLIYQRHFFVFKSRHLYIAAGIFLLVVVGYYWLREQVNPGYINAVNKYELGGRFNEVLENHNEDTWCYWNWTVSDGFRFWILMLPLGAIIGLRSASKQFRLFTLYAILLVVVHFSIITIAKTRIDWYTIPQYPYLSFLVAVFIFSVFRSLKNVYNQRKFKNTLIPYSFLLIIFLYPYLAIVEYVNNNVTGWWLAENMNMGYLMKDDRDGKLNIGGYKIICDELEPNLMWYIMADKGTNNIILLGWDGLNAGDTAAVFKEKLRQEINDNYYVTVLKNYHGVTIYKIDGSK